MPIVYDHPDTLKAGHAELSDGGTSDGLRDTGPYSARNTSKGALIDEAGRVFQAVADGTPLPELRRLVREGSLLTQRTRTSREQIWKALDWRYVSATPEWLLSQVTSASARGPGDQEFTSLLYVLYALRDRLTFDFTTEVLWNRGTRGRPAVSRNDVLDLLHAAEASQPQISAWTESTRIKLAGSVLTALRDFGVLEGKIKKFLVRPVLPLSTAAAILRIVIEEGGRGRDVLRDRAWRLFMLSEQDVAETLFRLDQQRIIRFEKVGTTVVLETPSAWEARP